MQTSQGRSHRQFVIPHLTSSADLLDLPGASPKPECLVRAATEDDMAAVTSIYREFVEKSTATFELVAPDEIEMSRRRQAVLDADLPYLVAELEGFTVGYCYASQFRAREGYRFTLEDSIYVRKDCIGYGLERALLTTLIAQCQARRAHSMIACICGINESSVALHASVGFVPVGTIPAAGTKFGEWLSLSMMQRMLV
jgi:phosphinothricin acetyltransferase